MAKQSQHDRPSLDATPMETVVRPSSKIGALSGGIGMFVGSFIGIIRSPNPFIFTIASGLQWFAVGTIYWASRSMILSVQGHGSNTRSSASGIAAAVAGGSAGAIARGRRNVLPGALVFGMLGFSSQYVYDRRTSPQAWSHNADGAASSKVTRGSWYPLKPLSDKEYEEMLHDKILRVNSQIAILDEDIRIIQIEARSR